MTIFKMPAVGNLGEKRVGADYMQQVKARAKRLNNAVKCKPEVPENQLKLPFGEKN